MPSWFSKLFNFKPAKPPAKSNAGAKNSKLAAVWLDGSQNPWKVPVLDLRPFTSTMVSMSRDPVCARNAVSFGGDDGTSFIGQLAEPAPSIATSLSYPLEGLLADGALFLPSKMEHKWAIFYHAGSMIFVRSWQRAVAAVAKIEVKGDRAHVTRIDGHLCGDDTERVADYLIRTHALGVRHPVPLTAELAASAKDAELWCMSMFGSMAEFATPHLITEPTPLRPLRTYSVLHIAIARGDIESATRQLDAGTPVTLLGKDGVTPLHWASAGSSHAVADLLLSRGSPVDARSEIGTTPLMSATESRKADWVRYFLEHSADPNAQDERGFTALHRAAEMGELEIVRLLLSSGADRSIAVGDILPLSLAAQQKHADIVTLLKQ